MVFNEEGNYLYGCTDKKKIYIFDVLNKKIIDFEI